MPPLTHLSALLRRRVEIIADLAWRDRDPVGHLEALAGISHELTAWGDTHKSEIDGQLRHFLKNASFQKALAYVETLQAAGR